MGTSAAAAKRHGPMVAVVVLLGAALIAASSALENEGHLIPFGVGATVVVGLIALAATWNRLALAFGLLVGTGIAAFAVGLALTLTVDGAEGWLDCGGPCSTLQNATGAGLRLDARGTRASGNACHRSGAHNRKALGSGLARPPGRPRAATSRAE